MAGSAKNPAGETRNYSDAASLMGRPDATKDVARTWAKSDSRRFMGRRRRPMIWCGQALPLANMLRIKRQVVARVDVPVTVDFEGGYATFANELAENLRLLLDTGIAGINFEDQVVGGAGLHGAADQASRISALRQAADSAGIDLFINARTDVFFHKGAAPHADGLKEAVARAKMYADAGANGIFVPGLADAGLITKFCAAQPLPVNIMRMGKSLDVATLANCGVGRISHGPGPFISSMQALGEIVRGA